MSSRPTPKVPRTPPKTLVREHRDVVDHPGMLWRVQRTAGEYVRAWNELRVFGPLQSMRWDAHPGPTAGLGVEGVLYAAGDITTALAEVYQFGRRISTELGSPALIAWHPTRRLRLLDLSGTWPLRNSASAALAAAPRPTCRRWARAIRAAWPELDGLRVPSTMTGRANIVLWSPAGDSFPKLPSFSRPLHSELVWSLVQAAAAEIGYSIDE